MSTPLRDRLRGLTPAEALPILDAHIAENPTDDDAFLLRGLKHWSLGHRAEAINDYMSALRLNPSSPAGQAIRAANDILAYRNTDLINP